MCTIVCTAQAGKEIIEALCSNSVTYAEKTEFAQEKYKKRKARKYMTTLTLRKPTAWITCEVGLSLWVIWQWYPSVKC